MYRLTLFFSDYDPEVEYFSTRGPALQFAKIAGRDGYLGLKGEDQHLFPYFTIRKITIEHIKDCPTGVKIDRPHPAQ